MLEVKYSSLPFQRMSDAETKVAATRLLLKISFITGWSLYEDDASRGILKEQFELKITESYPSVNVEEMEYAFRQNTTIKDWGKYMNLSMIDEVMIPYLNQRRELSDMEENLNLPALPEIKKEDELSDSDFLEANRSVYKLTKNFGLIHPRCYDLLTKDKKIVLTEEQKTEIRKNARSIFFGADNIGYARSLNNGEQDRLISLDCKKLAVASYFQNNSK